MVNRVVPADKFEEETRRLAEQLAAAPPLAVRPLKRILTAGDRQALEERLDDEARQQAHCFQSEDVGEGFAAFFEKRRPQFRGR
jgi:enoyl-CoA hydratase/carnithine racemase